MFEKILVPLDGTAKAEKVLPQVKKLCRPEWEGGTEIVLCMPLAGFRPPKGKTKLRLQSIRDEAQQYVAACAMKLQSQGYTTYGVLATGKNLTQAVVRCAKKERATLVALAQFRASKVREWVVGSKAAEILAKSRIPVLSVRIVPPSALTHILYPIQEKGLSRKQTPNVAVLAQMFGSQVTVLHVMPREKSKSKEYAAMKREVDRAVTELAGGDVSVQWRIRRGKAVNQIRQAVAENRADFIVSGPDLASELAGTSRVPVLSLPVVRRAERPAPTMV